MDSQTIQAAAAGWIIRRQADDCSDAEESQLNEWHPVRRSLHAELTQRTGCCCAASNRGRRSQPRRRSANCTVRGPVMRAGQTTRFAARIYRPDICSLAGKLCRCGSMAVRQDKQQCNGLNIVQIKSVSN